MSLNHIILASHAQTGPEPWFCKGQSLTSHLLSAAQYKACFQFGYNQPAITTGTGHAAGHYVLGPVLVGVVIAVIILVARRARKRIWAEA
jgi:hypothetical protein